MDFTLTHTRFGRSHVHPIGQLTHTRLSDGVPESERFVIEYVNVSSDLEDSPLLVKTVVVDLSVGMQLRDLTLLLTCM